jgi:ubiquinone biosynthesis protein
MPSVPTLARLVRVGWVLARSGLDALLLEALRAPPLLRASLRVLPWHWGRQPPRGVRLRLAFESLGPIYVKFGQLLATRRDVLPPDLADELVKLQDHVPPFATARARATIERAWEAPVEALLAEFEDTPLASASIAQVHGARLRDGTAVVVKVLRPGVARQVRRDLAVLHTLARAFERMGREMRRLRLDAVVAEFEVILQAELDLMREAGNAAQLKRNFAGSPDLYVPEVYFDLTRTDVLVQERIYGVPIDHLDALAAAGVDFPRLAEKGVEIFFRQVFEHNFFHADMHAGNIFVQAPARYLAVDFGIMGTLNLEDRRYLAENFVAFFNRDYARVAQAHLRAGWVPPDTRADQFESAIRAVCEPIFDKPLKDISFGVLLMRLLAVARSFDMHVQPQLVLLQKTLLSVEGLGRRLYPELDLWRTAKPFLERWVQEQMGWRALLRGLREEMPRYAQILPALPNLLHDALAREAEKTSIAAAAAAPPAHRPDEARAPAHRSGDADRRTVRAAVLGALAVGAAAVYALAGRAQPEFAGAPLLVWVLAAIALWLLAGRRTG